MKKTPQLPDTSKRGNQGLTIKQPQNQLDEIRSSASTVPFQTFDRGPRRRSWFKSTSFAVLVVLPTLLASVYFGHYASDQYVSETRFGVRSAEARGNDGSAIFQGMASASQIGLESNVVVQYAQSREIVDALQQKLDLRKMYSREGIDRFSQLDPKVSIEELVDYWRSKIDPFFDLTTGSISIRVKAFQAEDAQAIAAEVVSLSERLINDLSQRARSDTVKLAQEEIVKAENRLKKSRQAILEFRNKEQVINPTKQADASLELLSKLKDELSQESIALRTARASLSESSPTVKAILTRIKSLQVQIKETEALITPAGQNNESQNDALSSTIGDFDALETEQKFAEKYYDSSLESLQKAQTEANRQAIYLQVFVQPAKPEKALYPRRLQNIGLTLLASLGLWILVLLSVASIRDHA
jgi:capsular polysaccharide transport system permease protein